MSATPEAARVAVPREPTMEMQFAAAHAYCSVTDRDIAGSLIDAMWAAALSAAPVAPASDAVGLEEAARIAVASASEVLAISRQPGCGEEKASILGLQAETMMVFAKHLRRLDEKRRALPAAGPDVAAGVDAWRPIESAPRDGTRILLHTSDFGAVEGWWDAGTTNFYKSQEGWASYDPDNAQGEWVSEWRIGDGPDRRLYCGCTPTHWRPLPAPPQDAQS